MAPVFQTGEVGSIPTGRSNIGINPTNLNTGIPYLAPGYVGRR